MRGTVATRVAAGVAGVVLSVAAADAPARQPRALTIPTKTTTLAAPPVVPPPPPGPDSVDFGFDAAHDFAASDPSITTPLGPIWSIRVHQAVTGLLAAAGRIYMLTDDGTSSTLSALDPATGRTTWQQRTAHAVSIAYEDGVVAIGVSDEGILGYSASTGTRMWATSMANVGAITPGDDEFYVVGSPGNDDYYLAVGAINATSGTPRWVVAPMFSDGYTLEYGDGPLGLSGDRLYFSMDSNSGAIDRRNGATLWATSSGSGGSSDTSTLWSDRVFSSGFYGGSSPAQGARAVVSAASGANVGGVAPSVFDGNIGLVGGDAYDLTSGRRLWASRDASLAAVNNEALLSSIHGLKLRDLATGRLTWSAHYTHLTSLGSQPQQGIAVGNGEIVVLANGRLTALGPRAREAAPTQKFTFTRVLSVYTGTGAKIADHVTEPGYTQSLPVAVGVSRFPYRHRHSLGTVQTSAYGELTFKPHPAINTIYRVKPLGAKSKLFIVWAVPQARFHYLRPTGHEGHLQVKITVPRRIRLHSHKVSFYIALRRQRRYELLGTSTLHGRRRHFHATIGFHLLRHVPARSFFPVCYAGLWKQGMDFSDHLNRRCGARRIPF